MAKRVGNIYLPNCNYTCLYNAYRKAAKGKRYRGDVLQFTDNLEGNLLALLDDFGYTLDLGDLGNKLLSVVEALFMVLSILGIVVDPTTDGVGDSKQALTYTEPKK